MHVVNVEQTGYNLNVSYFSMFPENKQHNTIIGILTWSFSERIQELYYK